VNRETRLIYRIRILPAEEKKNPHYYKWWLCQDLLSFCFTNVTSVIMGHLSWIWWCLNRVSKSLKHVQNYSILRFLLGFQWCMMNTKPNDVPKEKPRSEFIIYIFFGYLTELFCCRHLLDCCGFSHCFVQWSPCILKCLVLKCAHLQPLLFDVTAR